MSKGFLLYLPLIQNPDLSYLVSEREVKKLICAKERKDNVKMR